MPQPAPLSRLGAVAALALLLGCAPSPRPAAAPTPVAPTIPPPPAPSRAGPPIAAVRPVTDVYFGTTVVDPYRWMESPSPELDSWMKAEDDFARTSLAALPLHDAFTERVSRLDDEATRVRAVEVHGGRTFYSEITAGENARTIGVREASGASRVLVRPETFAEGDHHAAIDWFVPSLDGAHVAFGVSRGGTEDSVIHVVDVATGALLPDAIDRGGFGVTSWLDARSFLYRRMQKMEPGAPAGAKYQRTRMLLHTLGTSPEDDVPVLGAGVSPSVPMTDDEWARVYAPAGESVLLGLVGRGTRRSVYVAPRAPLLARRTPPWTRVASYDDEVASVMVHGDDLFLRSHHGADRFRVLLTRASRPDLAHAKEVVPEGEDVITGIAAAKDALYMTLSRAGVSRMRRLPYGASKTEEVPLPGDGSVASWFADGTRPGILLGYTSWTTPFAWLAYDPVKRALTDTGLQPPVSGELSTTIASTEVWATSADGTKVPLSIVYPRSIARDGSNPTWLSGYGAYGTSLEPSFDPALFAWFERGGVFAVCHPRGGGELGEAWHLGGRIATKGRTIDDFIACARYLEDEGYTSPRHLGGEGTSAGGIAIGGALTRRPELFGAAIIRVGMSNMLRFETAPSGPSNVPEFGSVRTEEGFRALYAMDAYHHVRDGEKLPAVLLTAGANDPRVPSWQAAKMTARLQAAAPHGEPVWLRVEADAGHGWGSTKAQRDRELADEMTFLWSTVGPRVSSPSRAAAPAPASP